MAATSKYAIARSVILLGLVLGLDIVEITAARHYFSSYDVYDAYMPVVLVCAVCSLFQLLFIGMGIINVKKRLPNPVRIALWIHGAVTIGLFCFINYGGLYDILK